MRTEPTPFTPEAKRPRTWAAEILEGKSELDQVPADLRGFVLEYLRPRIESEAKRVLCGKTLEERQFTLACCPAGLRAEIEATALRLIEEHRNRRVRR